MYEVRPRHGNTWLLSFNLRFWFLLNDTRDYNFRLIWQRWQLIKIEFGACGLIDGFITYDRRRRKWGPKKMQGIECSLMVTKLVGSRLLPTIWSVSRATALISTTLDLDRFNQLCFCIRLTFGFFSVLVEFRTLALAIQSPSCGK